MVWECGGGTLLIFLLVTFSGIEQRIAQGANIMFFIPTCIVSIFLNIKNKNIKGKTALIVIISGIIGTIIGTIISLNIRVENLRKYFGLFLIFMSFFEIYSLIKLYIKNKKVDNKNIIEK